MGTSKRLQERYDRMDRMRDEFVKVKEATNIAELPELLTSEFFSVRYRAIERMKEFRNATNSV